MKLFLILMLVGYASATLFEALERESRDTVKAFISGLQGATPLHEALGIENTEEVQKFERGVKEELEKHIKDAFEKALKRIEDAVDNGHKVNEEALKKLKDLRNIMTELDIQSDEITEELEILKAKVDEQLRLILEKMGIIDKRSAEPDTFESVLGDLSIRDMFIKLKKMILEKIDVDSMKNSLAKIVGQGTQKLCEWLTNKGKEKVLNFFDRFLEPDEVTKKRAAEDRLEQVKDYLENIEQDVENKLSKFREWLQSLIGTGLEEAKEGLQNIKEIVKEIITHSKDLSRQRLTKILDYLRQYEDKFGSLYDLRNVIEEILSKKD